MPENQSTVIIMDNTGSDKVSEIGRGLIHILYGKSPQDPKQPISNVMYEIIASDGVKQAVARYRELSNKNHRTYDYSESELNRLGYYYLAHNEPEIAIRIFKLNVEVYPESANVYDSLGEAYMEAEKRKLAIQNYRKSLELEPDNKNARLMLPAPWCADGMRCQ